MMDESERTPKNASLAASPTESGPEKAHCQHPMVSNEELFRGLTLHSCDIISLLDAEGRLLYNSPATERINGFTPEELANIDTFEMIHPDDRQRVRDVFGKVLSESGSVHTVRYRYKTKDDRWLWMEAVASNQLDNPAVRGVVANSRDISERVRADEERARMQSQMLHVQKLESLGVLAGGVAHDFNNLLTVILGEADMLLLEGQSSPSVQNAAANIRNVAQRAAELTHLLLAYAGRGPITSERIDAIELIEDMRPLLELTVGKKSHLVVDIGHGPGWISADRRQLQQVVMNLVQNAAESADRNVTVTLTVSRCHLDRAGISQCIFADSLRAGPHLALVVEDDGEGLSREARERMFDPFYSTKQTGRGLGLAAVHGIVQRHQAGLAVESMPGLGTRLAIYLPLADAPTADTERLSDEGFRGTGTVLVIDDDTSAAQTTARLLEHLGFSVKIARSGPMALDMHRVMHSRLAFVVLDLVMPGMDGPETFRHLRDREPDLPILIYSGVVPDVAAPCLEEPATAFLPKPFTLQGLAQHAHRLIAEGRADSDVRNPSQTRPPH